MKINNIPAADYHIEENAVSIVFVNTDMSAITDMNTALLEVKTDDGDLVEVMAGYALSNILFDKATNTFTTMLVRNIGHDISDTLDTLSAKVAEQEAANSDIMLALAELGQLIVVNEGTVA